MVHIAPQLLPQQHNTHNIPKVPYEYQCSGTHQTVETVVQEDQQHGLLLQCEASLVPCQYSFHHTFEEEWKMAGLLLEHLIHNKR